ASRRSRRDRRGHRRWPPGRRNQPAAFRCLCPGRSPTLGIRVARHAGGMAQTGHYSRWLPPAPKADTGIYIRATTHGPGPRSRRSLVTYIVSSVALAYLLAEPRSPSTRLWQESLTSSALLEYEVWTRVNALERSGSLGEAVRA